MGHEQSLAPVDPTYDSMILTSPTHHWGSAETRTRSMLVVVKKWQLVETQDSTLRWTVKDARSDWASSDQKTRSIRRQDDTDVHSLTPSLPQTHFLTSFLWMFVWLSLSVWCWRWRSYNQSSAEPTDWNQLHSWSVKLVSLFFVDNPTVFKNPQTKLLFFDFYTFLFSLLLSVTRCQLKYFFDLFRDTVKHFTLKFKFTSAFYWVVMFKLSFYWLHCSIKWKYSTFLVTDFTHISLKFNFTDDEMKNYYNGNFPLFFKEFD